MDELLIQQYLASLKYEKGFSEATVSSYGRDIRKFKNYIDGEGISYQSVDLQIITNFLSVELMNNISANSCKRRMSSLRSFYDYLKRKNIVPGNPFRLADNPKGETKYPAVLFQEEAQALLEANRARTDELAPRDQAILELMLSSGLRASETVNLKMLQIDLARRVIRVRGKGNKDRIVPFSKEAKAAIVAYRDDLRLKLLRNNPSGRSEYLFLNSRGQKLTVRGLEYIMKEIEEKTGKRLGLHPHELRHSFATKMLERGADLRLIQEILGHRSINSTQIYTHLSQKEITAEYEKYFPLGKE